MRSFVTIVILALSFAALAVNAQTPAEIETQLIGHLKRMSESGTYGGNYEDEKLNSASDALKKMLEKNASRADVLAYGFPKLRDQMAIVTSPDGRFRVYSWDLQSGGTMHDYDMLIQYRGASGKIGYWTPDDEEFEGGGAYYTDVFQLKTPSGTLFLLASTAQASTSLHGQTLRIYRVKGDHLEPGVKLIQTSEGFTDSVSFAYDFFSVVRRPDRPISLFKFNPQRKEFSFPVVIEDEKNPLGRVTNKMITYRFDGKHFGKVR